MQKLLILGKYHHFVAFKEDIRDLIELEDPNSDTIMLYLENNEGKHSGTFLGTEYHYQTKEFLRLPKDWAEAILQVKHMFTPIYKVGDIIYDLETNDYFKIIKCDTHGVEVYSDGNWEMLLKENIRPTTKEEKDTNFYKEFCISHSNGRLYMSIDQDSKKFVLKNNPSLDLSEVRSLVKSISTTENGTIKTSHISFSMYTGVNLNDLITVLNYYEQITGTCATIV